MPQGSAHSTFVLIYYTLTRWGDERREGGQCSSSNFDLDSTVDHVHGSWIECVIDSKETLQACGWFGGYRRRTSNRCAREARGALPALASRLMDLHAPACPATLSSCQTLLFCRTTSDRLCSLIFPLFQGSPEPWVLALRRSPPDQRLPHPDPSPLLVISIVLST
jgi:hypothetical protein